MTLEIPQQDGSIIYIKSTAISSVAVVGTTYPKSGTFYGKATVQRYADGTVLSLDGGASLRMDVLDALGTPQTTTSQIVLTIMSSKTGELYYSNQWLLDDATKTWKTKPEPLNSGTLDIGN